jgi:hypothetical protein
MNRKPKLTLEQVRDICANSGLVLLSKEYLRRSAHLHCRCRKCLHAWHPWFPNVLRGSGCPMCARAKLATAKPKLSITEVRAYCRKAGLKCLAKKYQGRHYPLLCRCEECSHEWSPTFGKILMGRRCPKCANKKSSQRQTKPLSKLRRYFKGTDITLVGDANRSGKQRFCEFRCKRCGYKWTTTVYSMISANSGCKQCSRKRVVQKLLLPLNEVDRRLNAKGAERLDTFSSTSKAMTLRFIKCGHICTISLNSVVRGHGCPTCNGHKRLTAEDYHEFAKQHGGEVLSVARSASYRSHWKCSQGHEFERSISQMRHRKRFCPYCFSSYGEASARYIAEKLTGYNFAKLRLKGLRADNRYPLELDMYCEELKIAIEHHGDQHYLPFRHWGGKRKLDEIRKRDVERRRGCRKLGIHLIEIRTLRDKTPLKEFVRRLEAACKLKGVKLKHIKDLDKLDRESLQSATPERVRLLEKFKSMLRARRYALLEKAYLGSKIRHAVRCPRGHEFRVEPNKFMSGRGCPLCPRNVRNRVKIRVGRKTFPSIREAASHLNVDPSSLYDAMKSGRKCAGQTVSRIQPAQ